MNYLEYLDSFSKFKMDGGYRPGLDRVKAALARLGNPEKQVSVIHVAGTNGKGSTSAMLAAIYKAAGYQVGLYTSPHLQDFRERFRLNGEPISEAEVEAITTRIKPVIEEISLIPELGRPSYFEVVTVLAFLYFAEKKTEILVLEVGLGGRLDATNVVDPLAAVISTIGFDHMEYLGNTLKEIAGEKAGIIKTNRPVITGVQDEDAFHTIKNLAIEKNAPFFAPLQDVSYTKITNSLYGQKIDLNMGSSCYRGLEIALLGDHQIRNAIIAIKTVEILQNELPKADEKAIRQGLKQVKWPGRLELVQEEPSVLLDGAHNIEGIQALADFLTNVRGNFCNLYLVMSILKDKDFTPMLKKVAPLATGITLTQNHSLRASTAEELAQVLEGENVKLRVIPDFPKAITETISGANPDDLICITGSLYTISEARGILMPNDQGII